MIQHSHCAVSDSKSRNKGASSLAEVCCTLGGFKRRSRKLMRRALCVPSNPLAVASAHRALLGEPLAGSPSPAIQARHFGVSLNFQKLKDD